MVVEEVVGNDQRVTGEACLMTGPDWRILIVDGGKMVVSDCQWGWGICVTLKDMTIKMRHPHRSFQWKSVLDKCSLKPRSL